MTPGFYLSIVVPISALFCYGALAIMMARRDPESRVHRFFRVYLLVMMAWSGAALMLRLDSGRALTWNRVSLVAGGVLMPLTWFMFVQSFLGRNPWNRRILPGALMAILLIIATALGYMGVSAATDAQGRVQMQFGPALPLYAVYWVTYVAWSAVILVQAYRAAHDPAWRNRIRYPMIGTVLVLLGGATNSIDALSRYPLDIAANLGNALLLAYAIARYQLMDLTLVTRRLLAWSLGVIAISATYAASLFLLYQVFAARWIGLVVLGVAVSITMLAINPFLRDQLQFWVDRSLFRAHYDLQSMLQDLSRVTTRLRPLPELAELILHRVASTFGLTHTIFLCMDETGEALTAIAATGQHPGVSSLRWPLDHPLLTILAGSHQPRMIAELVLLPHLKSLWTVEQEELSALRGELFVPMLAHGQLLAVLVLGSKQSGEPFLSNDVTVLSTLANQTAVAIDNARLYQKLRQDAAALEQANIELRRLDQLKDEFIQNVSHELRTPLTCVQAYVELMLDGTLGPLTPGQRSGLQTVLKSGKRIVSMVNDIISLTKNEQDLLELVPQDLAALIQKSVEAARPVAASSHVNLCVRTPEKLIMAAGDARRLGQVLDNLMGNAIKFSPNGGEVVVQATCVGSEIHLTISDQGIGIPTEELPRIWDRFYQVDGSTKRRFGGSGLGLTIVKRIVEAHGGRVWAESTPGQGSRFTCAFPIGAP